MRLSGTASSSRLLRRIERFELDNGYFMPNQRRFTKAEAAKLTQPFPLMLYSFQISQPGGDYKSITCLRSYEMGQRGSTLRTFADFNLQATRVRKPIASYNPPPYFAESNDSIPQLPATPSWRRNRHRLHPQPRYPPLGPLLQIGSDKTMLFSMPSQLRLARPAPARRPHRR